MKGHRKVFEDRNIWAIPEKVTTRILSESQNAKLDAFMEQRLQETTTRLAQLRRK